MIFLLSCSFEYFRGLTGVLRPAGLACAGAAEVTQLATFLVLAHYLFALLAPGTQLFMLMRAGERLARGIRISCDFSCIIGKLRDVGNFCGPVGTGATGSAAAAVRIS